MKRTRPSHALALPAGILVATPVWAHSGPGLQGGFVAGVLHPLGGVDHLLAMIAVGLWGAFLGARLVVALPIVFPLLMVVGAVLGMRAMPLPPVELGIAASVLVLGLCIAGAWRAPAWLALAIVAVFALFHGYAHGLELPNQAGAVAYSAGFVLATGLIHLTGIGIRFVTHLPTKSPRTPNY